MERLSENVFLYRDTCNVYVVRHSSQAVLVDFGSGEVLDALPELGVCQVAAVLMTHHHRDQGQGLARAVELGIPIYAPHNEQDLFRAVDRHWQARPLMNNYDVRQDRFSLLDPVALSGTLKDYAVEGFGGLNWTVVPTPGHTPGSITLMTVVDGARLAFTGDLIAGTGKVHSMAALQWMYDRMVGAAASILSLRDLARRRPEALLPSHGEPMSDPQTAIQLLSERLRVLLDARQENMRMPEWLERPYEHVTAHLLVNRTSTANSYVLISDTGRALLIDYGYDFRAANVSAGDRAMYRPWLYTLDSLKDQYGITGIDAVIATHTHDDHVAGFNLLRDVEDAETWAAPDVAEVLETPERFNLPCLWFDPIPVDRRLQPGETVGWHEYAITLYPLPGHAARASAVSFEVDGRRVLAVGDQYAGPEGLRWNNVYQSGFHPTDYRRGAALYARLQPELILPGHGPALWVEEGYFDKLRESGELLERLHGDLQNGEQVEPLITLSPYRQRVEPGCPAEIRVRVRNPQDEPRLASLRLVTPIGWRVEPESCTIPLEAGAQASVTFLALPVEGARGPRFRVAVDAQVGSAHLGQVAEVLVDVEG